ncbi:MAG: cyclic nucleotide-binding domain-containing protein [Desulfobacterales bacterium]|nr:cyclic nucleotide-binding domain-containing protein [Desulfobacterales bacterium]
MTPDVFWGNIFKIKSKKDTLYYFLKSNPLFDGFSSRDIKNIGKIVHLRRFKKDEIIFKEDEPGTGMYVIRTGSVRITKHKKKEGGDSEEEVITMLKQNDFFGELALVEKTRFPRTASAYADNECELIGFFKPDLLELVERNPRLGVKIVLRIAEIIGSRLRTTTELLTERTEETKRLRPAPQQDEKEPISPIWNKT